MIAKNFNEIEKVIADSTLDVTDNSVNQLLTQLFETVDSHRDHEKQCWVYVDLASDYIKKSDLIEELDWVDINNWLKGDQGQFYFLKVYHPYSQLQLTTTDNFFNKLSQLKNIPGIYSYDFVAIKDVVVLDHDDGKDLPFMRLLYTTELPDDASIDNIGFDIEGTVISPSKEKFILFDPSKTHRAWNHTKQWWKFLIIDIKKGSIEP
jgi:hypothetical protein